MQTYRFKSLMMALLAVFAVNVATAQQPHVYINPGHGGYDSDDRNMVIYPFAQGDTAGSWESKSNLRKGLALREILEKKGYRTSISRVTNTSSDDLALSTIVALCNQSGADVFYSVHSNATGTSSRVNYSLALYRGYSGYPEVPGSDVLAACLEPILYANQSTVWTNYYQIYGDWTFRPDWGTQGYGVLRGNQAVSILSEGSFHDYVPEAYRLLSPYYCWMEGWNISLGADQYFGRLGQYDLGAVTGNVRDKNAKRLQECAQQFVVFGDDGLRPIHNATVRLLDAAGNEVQRCVTDTLRNGIYLFKYVTPGIYTVEVSTQSHYTQSKTVTVSANASTYQNFFLEEAVDMTPAVVDYSPVWHEGDPAVMCNIPVTLTFNWDMDSATTCGAFSIEPTVSGAFRWENNHRRLVFTPVDAFDVNTLYTVTLNKSAEQSGGTPMEEDFTMQFYTQSRNHLTELAVFPYEGAPVHLMTPTVELRVDSLLNTSNLSQRLRVLDSEDNEIPWNVRSVKNNKRGDDYGFIRISLSRDIEANKDYQLILDADIADTAGIRLPAARVINFTGVNAGADKPAMTVIEGFESADVVDVNDPVGVIQTRVTTSGDRLFGDKSLKVDYELDNQRTEVDIRFVSLPDASFVQGDTLGIHVWGDMSYNDLYVELQNGMEACKVNMGRINYHGWRYLKVPLNSLGEGSYQVTALQVVRGHELMGKNGTIRFDNLLKAQSSGINEAKANMRVNVAGDYIVVSADTWVQGVELLDVNGRTIKAAGGNCLNVADVASGVYLLRVIINGAAVTQKVRL